MPFYFSTFRLFDFSKFKKDTVPLFDFSKLTMKPFHFSTFYFSNFPVTCLAFSFSFSQNCCLPLQWKNTCSEKDASSKKTKVQQWKKCLHANTCYAWIPNISKYNTYLVVLYMYNYTYVSTTVAGSFDRWRLAMEK